MVIYAETSLSSPRLFQPSASRRSESSGASAAASPLPPPYPAPPPRLPHREPAPLSPYLAPLLPSLHLSRCWARPRLLAHRRLLPYRLPLSFLPRHRGRPGSERAPETRTPQPCYRAAARCCSSARTTARRTRSWPHCCLRPRPAARHGGRPCRSPPSTWTWTSPTCERVVFNEAKRHRDRCRGGTRRTALHIFNIRRKKSVDLKSHSVKRRECSDRRSVVFSPLSYCVILVVNNNLKNHLNVHVET